MHNQTSEYHVKSHRLLSEVLSKIIQIKTDQNEPNHQLSYGLNPDGMKNLCLKDSENLIHKQNIDKCEQVIFV